MRNHSVQYTSEPAYAWEKLRRNWPFIYESYADQQLEEWTKVKIDVQGRRATLYLNGSSNPSLIVDGLKGEDLQGAIALWSYSGEEAYFSNLRITPAKPEPIENGGDAAGTWDVQCNTDAGGFGGTLKLVRQYSTLSGIWSGGLGPDQAVNGMWRDGYVEFSFGGTWPEQPGTVIATLDGWIDGDSAKGRIKVEGRAMGRCPAFDLDPREQLVPRGARRCARLVEVVRHPFGVEVRLCRVDVDERQPDLKADRLVET